MAVDRAGFDAYLEGLRREREAKIAAIGGSGNGVELSNAAGTRYALLLPDCAEPEKWRIQWFTMDGFMGHAIYSSETELLEAAVCQGFTVRVDGALDRLAALPSFDRGNFAADLVRLVNRGQLKMVEADAALAAYDFAHEAA